MSSPQRDSFTGDGTTVSFALSQVPYVPSAQVFVNGLLQPLNAYSIPTPGQNVVFVSAPALGDAVIVYYYTLDSPFPPIPGSIDLTSVAAVRLSGNIPSTTPDAIIQPLITSWSRMFMTMTRRGMDLIAAQSVTEYRDGTGTDSLMLQNYPVISVASVTDGNAPIPAATPGAADFGWLVDLQTGLISLRGRRFCRGRMNVTVPYTYGWPFIPEDVMQAANEMTLWLMRMRDHVDLDMALLAGQTVKYKAKFPPDVCLVIDRYTKRRQVWGQ